MGFRGAYARTNLSFLFLGDFWNDRISSLIIVSGIWRFYRDDYYKGDHWDLGPGFYECFFKDRGRDDVVSSMKAIKLTVRRGCGSPKCETGRPVYAVSPWP